jgi:lysine 2,3-aminomutase
MRSLKRTMSKAQSLKTKRISNAAGLIEAGLAYDDTRVHLNAIEKEFAIGLSPHLVQRLKSEPNNSALSRQYLPDINELSFSTAEMNDPIGDEAHSPVKGIVHRYPDRVLLKVASACAVYCRYCFRREMIGPGSGVLSQSDLEAALTYIERTPTIREVILTGGDPLILSARQISPILERLSAIVHIGYIRIHTRVPIADPTRIGADYIAAMQNSCTKPLYLALHINHADELDKSVRTVIQNLHMARVVLISQSVLLKGVNDCPDILGALYTALLSLHVKPYYLHHPDMARGTKHFRLSLERGMKIHSALLGRYSGLCQPHYMLDIPGGHGKIPVHPGYVEITAKGCYAIRDYQGNVHTYIDDCDKE